MSSSVLSVSYAYPIPECFGRGTTKTISELKSSIESSFKNYTTARDNIFNQLKAIFGIGKDDLLLDNGHTKISDFAGKINECSDCDESNRAYKFYCNQIISKINKCSDYIIEANLILEEWGTLSGSDSSLIHADVVRLESLSQFCSEITTEFGTRYCYDYEEDNWKLATDDYKTYDYKTNTYSQIGKKYSAYSGLYNTTVKGSSTSKTLECFNELNLLDRLKYIKEYYGIKNGKTNYVFPEDKSIGFPCVAEEGIDETDTRIANVEKFYLGYLIDRDGPVNAFCALYELKVAALQETLKLMSQRIKALNTYLEFINYGMDLLNQSQTAKKIKEKGGVLPNGVPVALAYLCGQKMYNLFEDDEGNKYLVIPSVITKKVVEKTNTYTDNANSEPDETGETVYYKNREVTIDNANNKVTISGSKVDMSSAKDVVMHDCRIIKKSKDETVKFNDDSEIKLKSGEIVAILDLDGNAVNIGNDTISVNGIKTQIGIGKKDNGGYISITEDDDSGTVTIIGSSFVKINGSTAQDVTVNGLAYKSIEISDGVTTVDIVATDSTFGYKVIRNNNDYAKSVAIDGYQFTIPKKTIILVNKEGKDGNNLHVRRKSGNDIMLTELTTSTKSGTIGDWHIIRNNNDEAKEIDDKGLKDTFDKITLGKYTTAIFNDNVIVFVKEYVHDSSTDYRGKGSTTSVVVYGKSSVGINDIAVKAERGQMHYLVPIGDKEGFLGGRYRLRNPYFNYKEHKNHHQQHLNDEDYTAYKELKNPQETWYTGYFFEKYSPNSNTAQDKFKSEGGHNGHRDGNNDINVHADSYKTSTITERGAYRLIAKFQEGANNDYRDNIYYNVYDGEPEHENGNLGTSVNGQKEKSTNYYYFHKYDVRRDGTNKENTAQYSSSDKPFIQTDSFVRNPVFAETGKYLTGGTAKELPGVSSFKLPKELDVNTIIPESVSYLNWVLNYEGGYGTKDTYNVDRMVTKLDKDKYNAMIESWTNAFSNKVQYINTAIETINTDIEQLRSKIDTYYSQASTLRNRVHEVYLNTIRKIS